MKPGRRSLCVVMRLLLASNAADVKSGQRAGRPKRRWQSYPPVAYLAHDASDCAN
jgi:hypothetical protein